MRPKLKVYQTIRLDPLAKGYIILGIFLFFILAIFAIDYGDVLLALQGLTWISMILAGRYLGNILKPLKPIGDRGQYHKIIALALLAILIFVMLDVWAPKFFPTRFLTLPTNGQTALVIITGMLAGIGEEMLFRFGATNVFKKYSRSTLGAIIGSGFFFMLCHLGVYQDPVILFIVGVSGSVLAWIDFIGGRLSISITAHVLNNLFASLFSILLIGSSFNLSNIALYLKVVGL